MTRIVTLFVASPATLPLRGVTLPKSPRPSTATWRRERDVQFRVQGYETDVRPRVHEKGPQGPIDEDLPVGQCDIVVGILWKRLGTPIPEMGGETGTEHEIREAIAASSRQSGKPEVVLCINKAPYFSRRRGGDGASRTGCEVSQEDPRPGTRLPWPGGFPREDSRLPGEISHGKSPSCKSDKDTPLSPAIPPATSRLCVERPRPLKCKD